MQKHGFSHFAKRNQHPFQNTTSIISQASTIWLMYFQENLISTGDNIPPQESKFERHLLLILLFF
jgi:hypothetical protein